MLRSYKSIVSRYRKFFVSCVSKSFVFWDWADVAEWLFRHERISKEEALEAGVVSAANEKLVFGVESLPGKLEKRTILLEAALA